MTRRATGYVASLAALVLASAIAQAAPQNPRDPAQRDPARAHHGAPIPPAQRTMFERGLGFLVARQDQAGQIGNGTGVTAIAVMALIASGEDPNFGRYAEPVRKALRYIIRQQDTRTGHIRSSMYEHGFAMLALADCYGAVDERLLWRGEKDEGRSMGKALELAVRCAITSQESNPFGAWRYSPNATDADTSVAGAVLMGLLGARNAGVAVPDEALDKALTYFQGMTLKDGTVAYSGGMGHGDSHARSAITALVYAVGKRKDTDTYKAAMEYVSKTADDVTSMWGEYRAYYLAQALFQGNYPLWRRWTKENTERLADLQSDNGAILLPNAAMGEEYSTAMALLSAGVSYCFLPIYER